MLMKVETVDVVTFSVILAVYVSTLSPTIAGGDSGELVAEGCVLGTPHPPGYPLFLLMVNALFRLRPLMPEVVPVAYMVNVTSAFFTAAAAVLVGMITRRFSRGSAGCGLFSACMFAFSPLIWQYAVTAEVFPMNTFLTALLVAVTLQFTATRSMTWVLVGAFVSGLGLCNQHTSVLFAAPLILYVTFLIRRVLLVQPQYIALIGAAFFAGTTPYLALPVVAHIRSDGGSWGEVRTLDGFVHHFLRRDYGTFQLFSGATGRDTEGLLERCVAWVADLHGTQGLFIVPLLLLVGVAGCVWEVGRAAMRDSGNAASSGKARAGKKKAPVVVVSTDDASLISQHEVAVTEPLLLPAVLSFYFSVFHALSNLPLTDRLLYGIHQRFWMQPNVLAFALGGVGLHYVFRVVGRMAGYAAAEAVTDGSRLVPRYSVLPIAVAAGFSLLQLTRWHFVSDQSGAAHFSDYAMAILAPLPAHSLLFINYDQQWTSIRYMQSCEGFRRDVTTINLSMMSYPWFQAKQERYQEQQRAAGAPVMKFPGDRYGSQAGRVVGGTTTYYTMADIIRANIARFDVFLSGKLSYTDPKLAAEFESMPLGLASQFIRKGAGAAKTKRPSATEYMQRLLVSTKQVLELLPELPPIDRYSEETWEWTIGRDFKDRLNDAAASLLEQAIADVGQDVTPLVAAIYMLEVAVQTERHFPRPARESRLHSNNSSNMGPFALWEGLLRGSIDSGYHRRNPAPPPGQPPCSLLKNAGLAHMHAVQNQAQIDDAHFSLFLRGGEDSQDNETHFSYDVFNIAGYENATWPLLRRGEQTDPAEGFSKWCVSRFVALWTEFLQREESRDDPQYDTIKGIFEKATAALRPGGKATSAGAGAGTGATAPPKTPAKKKKGAKARKPKP